MNKKILFLILYLFQHQVKSDINLTWFGTTNFSISDGETSLLFDPFFTKPSLFQVVTLQNIKSDLDLTQRWLKKVDYEKTRGIFVSHSHYDHVLDLVSVARLTKSRVYGSNSVENILKGSFGDNILFQEISDKDTFQIGKFKVTVMSSVHPPHILGYMLADGDIVEPLPAKTSALSYKVGKVFSFFIEHPEGNIFFHPSGVALNIKKIFSNKTADVVIQGIANKDSTTSLIENNFLPLKAKKIIPAHYDGLFTPLDSVTFPIESKNLEEFRRACSKSYDALLLKYGQTIRVY